jgi:hypothetical protein
LIAQNLIMGLSLIKTSGKNLGVSRAEKNEIAF